jgi:hypothetical protein
MIGRRVVQLSGCIQRRCRGEPLGATLSAMASRIVDQLHDASADVAAGVASYDRIGGGRTRGQREGQGCDASQSRYREQARREAIHGPKYPHDALNAG